MDALANVLLEDKAWRVCGRAEKGAARMQWCLYSQFHVYTRPLNPGYVKEI